jgi:hypothetical protein
LTEDDGGSDSPSFSGPAAQALGALLADQALRHVALGAAPPLSFVVSDSGDLERVP